MGVALGLFLLMGVTLDIIDWFKRRSQGYMDDGESGSGMEDGG